MAEEGEAVPALPFAVFEDRNAPGRKIGVNPSTYVSSPPVANVKATYSKAKAEEQEPGKQPEVSNALPTLAGTVMMLHSHLASPSQTPSSGARSTPNWIMGHSDQLLSDDLMSPPSPRSMQILGKSRGLKRDRLDSSQSISPAKRPASHPMSATKVKPQKAKAPVASLALFTSGPQPTQPAGSNWWAQGSHGQLMQDQSAWLPANQVSMQQNYCRWTAVPQTRIHHMQPPGHNIASWVPASASNPPPSLQTHPQGQGKQMQNDPNVWVPAYEQQQSDAWLPAPSMSQRGNMPATGAMQQPPQSFASQQPDTRAQQHPQPGHFSGRSLGMHMHDLVDEILAHDTPACWTNGSAQHQHNKGSPSPAAWADGHCHGPPRQTHMLHEQPLVHGQPGQMHLQNEQLRQGHLQFGHSWPAPAGGLILAAQPAGKAQRPKKNARKKAQRLAQPANVSGSLSNGHAVPARFSGGLQGGLQQLHQEVELFARMAAPTVAEIRAVQHAQSLVTETAHSIWPSCTVGSFGSQANATALPGSDIDITILGVMDFDGASGIKRHQRDAVKAQLQKLQKALRKKGAIAGKTMIIGARVPIIKCNLAVLGNQIPADISLGVANGLSAVAFVEQQALAIGPSMKALAVVLKALLQQAGLNERVAGGLGSYCLLNLVMAHLMSQGVDAQSQYNLGHLLLSFLHLFGNTFDYQAKAVSVRMGGIVKKERAFKQKGKPFLLTIEDPQQPGTDIGSGAFNIEQAVDMLSKAHTKLNYVAEQWAGQAPGWAAVQAEGQNSSIAGGTTASFPLLSSIMDPGLALERTVQAAQARVQNVKQSMDKVVKHANVTKKRKAREQPSHMRWEEEESDTERLPPPRKKQKQVAGKPCKAQAKAKAAKRHLTRKQAKAKAADKQAAKRQAGAIAAMKLSRKQSAKKRAAAKAAKMQSVKEQAIPSHAHATQVAGNSGSGQAGKPGKGQAKAKAAKRLFKRKQAKAKAADKQSANQQAGTTAANKLSKRQSAKRRTAAKAAKMLSMKEQAPPSHVHDTQVAGNGQAGARAAKKQSIKKQCAKKAAGGNSAKRRAKQRLFAMKALGKKSSSKA